MASKISVLGIPGSLRPDSSSHKVLVAVGAMTGPDTDFRIWDRLVDIPPFDGAEDAPQPVKDFRLAIAEADAVLICTPEYAFGIPGALKNALDWTVITGSLNEKVAGLITASSNGTYAHDAMQLVLKALGARVPEEGTLLIRFVKTMLDAEGHIKDENVRQGLETVWKSIATAIEEGRQ